MRDTIAVCGLFCESCGIHIATRNKDDIELERLAAMMKTTKEEIQCDGCRSGVLSPHCRNCEFRSCAQGKQMDNCEECRDFPCESIKDFQKKAPHRAELFESAEYRKNKGIDLWLGKMRKDYSCPICHTINSPYFSRCGKCGSVPCNEFRKRNMSLFKN